MRDRRDRPGDCPGERHAEAAETGTRTHSWDAFAPGEEAIGGFGTP
jgi:hypothetical protein